MIFDELSEANNLLKNKDVDFFRIKDLTILAKYFRHVGMDWKETETNLLNFCKSQNVAKYDESRYYLIERALRGAKKYKLRVPTVCSITREELKRIETLQNPKAERILFVILCLTKYLDATDIIINKKQYDEKKLICWTKSGIIFKMARYSNNFFDRNMLLGDIERTSLIKTIFNKSSTKTGIVLNVYYPESEPIIYFNNPENVYKLYKAYKDGKIMKCSECGLTTIKNSNRQLLCDRCWVERRKIIDHNKYEKKKLPPLENPANR